MNINNIHITEAEVQYRLCKSLERAGFNVYLEREFPLYGFGLTYGTRKTRKIRVDVVVCSGKKILGLIEVKNFKGIDPKPVTKGRQIEKYRHLSLPFRYCLNDFQVNDCVEWAKKLK